PTAAESAATKGHRGVQGTFDTLRKRVFWPHLFSDVRHHVRSCHDCQSNYSTRSTWTRCTCQRRPKASNT
ncbi:hypothetical protein K523DRAFT_272461, partial [Schizophyllum commune Tattone D]